MGEALVDGGVTCLNCGYDLRGIAAEGACPECGLAVRASRREDRLREAPERWVRRLWQGSRWFGVGALLSLPLAYVGLAGATVGAWMLTAGEPGRPEPARDWRLRWAARLMLVGGAAILVGLFAAVVVMVAVDRHAANSFRGWRPVDALLIAGHGLYWLGLLALSGYVEGLAQRIPDSALIRRARRFRWVWAGGMSAIVVIALAGNLADVVYTRFNVHYPWGVLVFAGMTGLVLLGLWIETLVFARHLARGLSVLLVQKEKPRTR